jgi:eukaryotic-like serine/threonine-protein kinase
LEALTAYTLGRKAHREKGDVEAIPFDKRAIELDPNFALAYEALGTAYSNLNQPSLAAEYLKKAFDLRDRVTEREKFHVTSLYYDIATGELEKANQAYELWRQDYPRDDVPPANLGSDYMILGQYEKAATETREALRLGPNNLVSYDNLGQIYPALNRFDEAKTTTEEAQGRKLEDVYLHLHLYALAFFQGNASAMKQQADWAIGKPSEEDQMLSLESDTEAWSGRLGKARELPDKLWRALAAAMKKSPPPYGKQTRRYAKRCSATRMRPARMLLRQWRSRQGATMRRRRRRWPMRWRAMRLTPNHLRMTSPSASRRIPLCKRSGCLLSVLR